MSCVALKAATVCFSLRPSPLSWNHSAEEEDSNIRSGETLLRRCGLLWMVKDVGGGVNEMQSPVFYTAGHSKSF
jgi:hypothetical protein